MDNDTPVPELSGRHAEEQKFMQVLGEQSARHKPHTVGYLFSEAARRVLFFASYEAHLRSNDKATHHITLEDLQRGIARETGTSSRPLPAQLKRGQKTRAGSKTP